ncbi:SCO family protein [Sphingomonas sp. URHD0057]|uniref:SCO family protein n=1 Tax=Sphingomonas sp. URHD0057 TaxID=1380389 RepID=UPI0006871004|nr:SCO family protein [Sphingomonas sp. URHD0057]
MADERPPRDKLKQVRILLWVLVALALIGMAALLLYPKTPATGPEAAPATAQASFGGPFTLVGGDGKPFSSQALEGKPYAIYFGYTRCGDVCPTTLSRLVKLRRAAANDNAMAILFVTIDPANDGPKEVGQYAGLFGAPIIGLTGSQAQIDQVKKQYGIFAQPAAHPSMGQEMEHSTAVLLFGRDGRLAGTIAPQDKDADAIAKIKAVIG